MLTEAQINEIFDQMRATARQLQDDYGNGQFPASGSVSGKLPERDAHPWVCHSS